MGRTSSLGLGKIVNFRLLCDYLLIKKTVALQNSEVRVTLRGQGGGPLWA